MTSTLFDQQLVSFSVTFGFYLFGFGSHTGSAQGLFLALCSGDHVLPGIEAKLAALLSAYKARAMLPCFSGPYRREKKNLLFFFCLLYDSHKMSFKRPETVKFIWGWGADFEPQ